MAGIMRMAMELFHSDKEEWKKLMLRGMQEDFSWNSSVAEYENLYQSLKNTTC